MSDREIGSIFDGKYEIERPLAGGGMGQVYLVRHLHLDELRVIKVLRPQDAADPAAQKRFLRAARTATQIKHPNVAILYDFSNLPDGSFYMVWEYVDGEDVGHWIEHRGPFPLDLAVDLGIQALRGLEAIHSRGVIHRDVSPDNLMITRDVRGRLHLKIIDLGLAKSLQPEPPDLEVTQAGMFMGKLRYCSPEQAGTVEGVVLDRRTDLYSFAAVFYEMICGRPPFDADNPHGFVFKRLTEDPLPLVGRAPGIAVPPGLDQVVRTALERDREKRFATAVRFIEALERVANDLRQVATQEMPPMKPMQKTGEAAGNPQDPGGTRRPSSQLTREERDELLAQIHRASRRQDQTRDLLRHAGEALERGRLDEARRLITEAEKVDPRAHGVRELKSRIQAEETAVDATERLREAEEILERYIANRQLPLARLALQTLLELSPDHPRRQEHERRIRTLAEEADREQRAGKVLEEAREALLGGDLKAARRKLAGVRKADPSGELAAAFEAELAAVEADEERTARVAEHRHRLDEALSRRQFDRAEKELTALAGLEVPKVTLDRYHKLVDRARRASAMEREGRGFEESFAERVQAGDWRGAREVTLELEQALPRHPRLGELFAEVERLREEHERRQAMEQGLAQVESFLDQGKAREAEMALTILLKMDPQHPKRKLLEKRIAALR